MKVWQKYSVGTPSTRPNWTEPDCQSFDAVSHVTHISSALAIIRQKTIRPQLVYDESILNKRRILVTWTSPNYWNRGFRYGNVSFDFNWKKLVDDKRFYWVEVMDYNPVACRILITDNNYDADPELEAYDPTNGDGPWWWNTEEDVHYRNGNICLEIMLECEFSTESWEKLTFVKHHDSYCCIDAVTCSDKGQDHFDAGARFIAAVISEDIDISGIKVIDSDVRDAWSTLAMSLTANGYTGGVTSGDEASYPLAKSVAFAHHQKRKHEQNILSRLFRSPADLETALHRLVAEKFPNTRLGDSRFTPLVDT